MKKGGTYDSTMETTRTTHVKREMVASCRDFDRLHRLERDPADVRPDGGPRSGTYDDGNITDTLVTFAHNFDRTAHARMVLDRPVGITRRQAGHLATV